jgi:hypothetical protein
MQGKIRKRHFETKANVHVCSIELFQKYMYNNCTQKKAISAQNFSLHLYNRLHLACECYPEQLHVHTMVWIEGI